MHAFASAIISPKFRRMSRLSPERGCLAVARTGVVHLRVRLSRSLSAPASCRFRHNQGRCPWKRPDSGAGLCCQGAVADYCWLHARSRWIGSGERGARRGTSVPEDGGDRRSPEALKRERRGRRHRDRVARAGALAVRAGATLDSIPQRRDPWSLRSTSERLHPWCHLWCQLHPAKSGVGGRKLSANDARCP